MYKKQLEKIFKANKKILITNAYGPTETTVSVSSSLINKDNYKKLSLKAMSIGKANVNNEIVLLDKNFKRKNEGEIFIAGKQVSPGYLNQSHETKNKFILQDDIYITRQRHRTNLEKCVEHLTNFEEKKSLEDFDKAAEDLRLATRYLGTIVGKVDVEEILGSIFNDFCIGK